MSGDVCKPVGLRDVNVHSMPSTSSCPTTSKRSARRSGRFALCRSPGRPSLALGDQLLESFEQLAADTPSLRVGHTANGPSRCRCGSAKSWATQSAPQARQLWRADGGSLVLLDVRLPVMADQVRRAITRHYENARSFDGGTDHIYVSSHSLGGHLAGVLLTSVGGIRGARGRKQERPLRERDVRPLPCTPEPARLLCGALRRSGGGVLADPPHRANSQPVDVAYGDEKSPTSSASPATVYPRSKRPGPHELNEPASTNPFEVVRRWPSRTAHSPARR